MRSRAGWMVAVVVLLAVFGVSSFLGGGRRAKARPHPQAASQGTGIVEYCILFGVGETRPAAWDGSLEASGARVIETSGWREAEDDRVRGAEWKLATRRVQLTRGANVGRRQGALENGLYVTAELTDAAATFRVKTPQGDFSFRASDVAPGEPALFLDGKVSVEQIPVVTPLTSSEEEQDHPALAVSGGKGYLAYVEFTHGDRSQDWPRQLKSKPESFESLRRPAGGDQALLREYSIAERSWGEPQPVSEKGQDIYKTAVAVDGEGRVWVVWSAQVKGNFDIYARVRAGGSWSAIQRVTEAAGPDLAPVATTASDGAVWIAWQGYRDGFDALAARQDGKRFGPEQRVSTAAANDWAPAIAAGPGGEVAVSWDTYDKGDYDVYLRRMKARGASVEMQAPQAVAATLDFEARSSLAYDAGGRLWAAWEESYKSWGKDFGAYETTGVGLYQNTWVRVKAFSGDRVLETEDDFGRVLETMPPSNPVNRGPGRVDASAPPQPDPNLVADRRPSATPYPASAEAKEGYPRLATDASGNVFLAYRSSAGRVWGPLGTAWFEHLARFDGERWQGPIFVGRSDGILDQRPALASTGAGHLLMVGPTDARFTQSGRNRGPKRDFNYDLMAYEVGLGSGTGASRLKEVPAAAVAEASPDAAGEASQIRRMREYRAEAEGQSLRPMRGEFHRHSSISSDGGNDGDIIDSWRYLVDASSMDWAGCCDHDNGNGREYTWWWAQKMTDAYHLAGKFVPLFSYERSVRYPEGHRNVLFAQRGIRPLPRLPKTDDDSPDNPAPDTQMFYEYLRQFGGVTASHTSGTNMGTDWRDNDPVVEPFVEIYQGDRQNYEMPDAPRSNDSEDSIGGWRPRGFVSNALDKGYKLAFEASSDHISTHMSYGVIWVTEPTREALIEAVKKRRVYAATDNILADFRCAGHFMGEEFSLDAPPRLEVKLVGTAELAKVHIIKDGAYVYSVQPGKREVDFTWTDQNVTPGKTSYYYVRGEQVDGEIVWVSPMWITAKAN
ncbi:MAG: hypothetical protein GC160_20305 [Acidobacteria bacterium]|nr:hypothetical protein [Acidobacteriota bacterium]